MKKMLLGAAVAFSGAVYADPNATSQAVDEILSQPAQPAQVQNTESVAPIQNPAPIQNSAPAPAAVVAPAAQVAPVVQNPAPQPVVIVNQTAPAPAPAPAPKSGVDAEIESLERENKLMSLRLENAKLKKYELLEAKKEESKASAKRKSGFILGAQIGGTKLSTRSNLGKVNESVGLLGLRAGYQKFFVNSLGFRIYGDVMGGGTDDEDKKYKNPEIGFSQASWAVNLDLMLDFNISKNVAFGVFGGVGYGASTFEQEVKKLNAQEITTKRGKQAYKITKDKVEIEGSTQPDLIINAGAGIAIKQKHRIEVFYKKTGDKLYKKPYNVTAKSGNTYSGTLTYKPSDIVGVSYQYTF